MSTYCAPGSFGIGTSLTNDFKTKSSGYIEKSRALNMVVKLAQVDDKHCVKISDDLTKVWCMVISSIHSDMSAVRIREIRRRWSM